MADLAIMPPLELLWMYRRDESGHYVPLDRDELESLLAELPRRHKQERDDQQLAHNMAVLQLEIQQANEIKRTVAAIRSLEQANG
jgi:hypothetical protein